MSKPMICTNHGIEYQPWQTCPDCDREQVKLCDTDIGVWFKSAISGCLYKNHAAAGEIDAVLVDGVWYEKPNTK